MAGPGHKDGWWVRLSWWWLALLAPMLVYSNGRWQLAIAALAAPFLARLFLFSQPVVRGLLILLPLQIAAHVVMWWEVIPVPGVLYYVICTAYAMCYFLPFVADRILSRRIAGFAATLVLPVCWYLVEVLIQIFTPYGSWTSLGYTQTQHGVLLPLAAWLGVSGVAFVTVWAASAASWWVTAAGSMKARTYKLALWAGAMAVLVWLAKMPSHPGAQDARSVKVAAITPSDEGTRMLVRDVAAVLQSGNPDPAFVARIEGLISELNEDLMRRSRAASVAGAQLLVWSETAGHVLGSGEGRFVARGQALAREQGIYLFMGLGVWHPGGQPPLENKVIAVTPSGDIAWQYSKARPIAGSEAPLLPPGHNELPTLQTPFGRIGLVICHDLDFTDFVAQAGRSNVDLLLAPSADWQVIADLHARMGIMRAVENGFWLFRPAYDGLSVIASPRGRVTRSEYDAELEERIMFGRIPAVRTNTMYPRIRQVLPLAATMVLLGLILAARGGSRA